MNIISKQIERSNIIFLFPQGMFPIPEAAEFFRLHTENELKGSNFVDDSVMRLRIFDLPASKLKWMFEPDKVRLDDVGNRRPSESKMAREFVRFLGDEEAERVKDFGWQYSVSRHKGAKTELYFFKAVSPLELAVHVNVHFQGTDVPEEKNLERLFEECYTDLDKAIERLSF